MLGSFSAEFLKIRKRPATWVLLFLWIAVVALIGYFLFYATSSATMEGVPEEQAAQMEAFNESIINGLLPENLLANLFSTSGVFGIGGSLALILGALAAGSEYGWGTMKTALTQRPGRLGFLAGKTLSFILVLALFVLVGIATGAASSLVVASLENSPVEWPGVGEMARGFGAGAVILAVYGLLGFALATMFRGTALAIGLGLAWVLAVESAIALLPVESDLLEGFRKLTLGENTLAVSSAFGSAPEGFGIPEPLIEPGRGVVTLIVYVAVFTIVSAVILKRRDVA